ncbi:MAG: hypothetical protein KJO98_08235 [Rhodothermia bacterium]|nr:hypothetical protein [Rhodothermia bacterium]
MSQPERRVDFDSLNLLGKAVYVGGSAVRILANAIDNAIDRAVDVVVETEKAFKQGLDPNVEDAKILQETTQKKSRSKKSGPRTPSAGDSNKEQD